MKKIYSLISFLLLFVSAGKATHISYEDMSYKWISGNTYEFTLTLYRECGGAAAPTSVLISYCTSSGPAGSITLPQVAGTGLPVFPVCSYPSSVCTGGTDEGFQKYVYRATHNMGSARSDWKFYHTYCCRESVLNTISTPLTTGTGIVMTMNNLDFPGNSSPTFNDEPVLFACCNMSYAYNQSATDIDGDSLVYSLNYPWNDNISCTNLDSVNYLAGYSGNAFLTTAAGINMNASTGYLTMNPTNCTEKSVMGVRVEQYSGGVLIGYITRDNMVIVTNETAAAIEENTEEGVITISPNPTTGFVTVIVHASVTQSHIQVLNVLGEKIYESEHACQKTASSTGDSSKMELDLSSFPAGIYFIRVGADNDLKTNKLMKLD